MTKIRLPQPLPPEPKRAAVRPWLLHLGLLVLLGASTAAALSLIPGI